MEHHELHKVYSALDFSLLPTQLEETWKATTNPRQSDEAYSELNRFITVISLYQAFATTYNKRTNRNTHLRDQIDLAAYMVRNSKIGENHLVDCNDPSLKGALAYIDKQTPERKLTTDHKEQAEKLYQDQLTIHRYLWEQDRQRLLTLSTFLTTHKKKLTEPQPFINDQHEYENIIPGSLFHRLDVSNQIEIADGSWRTIDLQRRSTQYILVIKLLFDCLMDRSLHTRHPYLIARWSHPLEIAQHIIHEAKENESTMRIMANGYAIVSGISVVEIVEKCLNLLNFSRRGMISIAL